MKAVRHTKNGIEVQEVPPPAGEGVLINVRSAGICGSDLSAIKLGSHSKVIMGHELAGCLEDGRAVAVEPLIPCGECDQCLEQNYHRCRAGYDTFVAFSCDGGMAEQLRLPERCLVMLPETIDVKSACLIEPLAVAVHGIRQGAVRAGQRVGIIGGGSIGQLCAAVAVAEGADVYLKSRHPAQAQAAEKLGVKPFAGKGKLFASEEKHKGEEFDVIFDCAGTESALDEAVNLLRPGGKLVLMAVYPNRISLPGMTTLFQEIQVIPSMTYNQHEGVRDIDRAAAMLAEKPDIAQAVITHRFPLQDAGEAFRVAQDRGAGAIKVVLEP